LMSGGCSVSAGAVASSVVVVGSLIGLGREWTFVDGDAVDVSNLNRQLASSRPTPGGHTVSQSTRPIASLPRWTLAPRPRPPGTTVTHRPSGPPRTTWRDRRAFSLAYQPHWRDASAAAQNRSDAVGPQPRIARTPPPARPAVSSVARSRFLSKDGPVLLERRRIRAP
jgi:hypothetical protein